MLNFILFFNVYCSICNECYYYLFCFVFVSTCTVGVDEEPNEIDLEETTALGVAPLPPITITIPGIDQPYQLRRRYVTCSSLLFFRNIVILFSRVSHGFCLFFILLILFTF